MKDARRFQKKCAKLWEQRARAFMWLSEWNADRLHEEQAKNAKLLKEKSDNWCQFCKANTVLDRVGKIANEPPRVEEVNLVLRIKAELDKL